MNKILVPLLCFLFTAGTVSAQRPTKTAVGQSGCYAYFMCPVTEFGTSYSEDSSAIYTGECTGKDSLNYGIICVKLKEHIDNGAQAEDIMLQYMDYLKKSFDITASAGYGKGHTLTGYPAARGVIDYWTDNQKHAWKVKGWTDGHFIAVMYVASLKENIPEDGRTELFLNGIRFPGMQ